MSLDPTFAAMAVLAAAPTLLLVMFLPAVLELNKPLDAGPRQIMDIAAEIPLPLRGTTRLVDLETGEEFSLGLIPGDAGLFGVLGNIEF